MGRKQQRQGPRAAPVDIIPNVQSNEGRSQERSWFVLSRPCSVPREFVRASDRAQAAAKYFSADECMTHAAHINGNGAREQSGSRHVGLSRHGGGYCGLPRRVSG